MKLQINALLDGKEILNYFVSKLKESNIECPWKEGSDLPLNVRILVTNKNSQDVEITPDKIKVVFNRE
jgi:hypothetical protein